MVDMMVQDAGDGEVIVACISMVGTEVMVWIVVQIINFIDFLRMEEL